MVMMSRDGAVKNQSLTLGEERKVTTPIMDVDSKAGLDGGPTQCTNAPPLKRHQASREGPLIAGE